MFCLLTASQNTTLQSKTMARSKSLHEVTTENEATLSQSPALLASTATGTKRSRDDDKNEDSFYGRRPAKSRSKNLEQDEKSR